MIMAYGNAGYHESVIYYTCKNCSGPNICCFYVILSYLSYCLFLGETLVFEFVSVHIFSAVQDSDLNSAFTVSTSFGWLLFSSDSTDKLILIYTSLAYVTTLCCSLRRPGHLFDSFLNICNYFTIVLVCFGSIVGEPTHFSCIGLSTSSFWIRRENDPPLLHFSLINQ
jgi:hypothetical protein